MASDSATVSVVLLSYNRPADLARALPSVIAQTCQPMEIIVVDNLSPSSPDIARLVKAHPGVRFLARPTNTGFTGGMNQGIRAATGRYVHLTGDDVVMAPDCVARLAAYAAAHPRTILSGVMLDAVTGRILSAGGDVRLEGVFRQVIHGAGQGDTDQFPSPFEVSYIPGAMVFAERSVFEDLCGFRDDFFVYYEDTDFCLRARERGYRIVVEPRARVTHFPADPGPASDTVEFHRLKNFFALYLLHARPAVWPEFLARYAVWGLLRPSARGHRRVVLRALAWTGRHATTLLADRRRRGGGPATSRSAGST